MEKIIYHLVLPSWWESFEDKDFYESETLEQETFIHLSTKNQVEGTLNNYFKGTEKLFLLHIEVQKLTSQLVFEDLHGHGTFPHLYGRLNKKAVIEIENITPNSDGTFSY
jgi:uncharacterized protein (DUF952 family)